MCVCARANRHKHLRSSEFIAVSEARPVERHVAPSGPTPLELRARDEGRGAAAAARAGGGGWSAAALLQ